MKNPFDTRSFHHGLFSLVELLIVISIMAILTSMVQPAITSMLGQSRVLVCQSILRQVGAADALYVEDHDGWTMPAYSKPNPPSFVFYYFTDTFRNYLGIPLAKSGIGTDNWVLTEQYLCPDSPRYQPAVFNESLKDSYLFGDVYGMNVTNPVGVNPLTNLSAYTYPISSITNPSHKLRVADSTQPLIHESNSTLGNWFEYGDGRDTPSGMTAFRHKEASNILYFDGHIELKLGVEVDMNDDLWQIHR